LNLIAYEVEESKGDLPDTDVGEVVASTDETIKPITQARAEKRKAEHRPQIIPDRDPRPDDEVWGIVSMSKWKSVLPRAIFGIRHR
jgi:hypothetical protein